MKRGKDSMKLGNLFSLELRENWKGLMIFSSIAILLIFGFLQVTPSFTEAFREDLDLEGSENLDIEIVENMNDQMDLLLSWRGIDNVEYYTLFVGDSPEMIGLNFDNRIDGIRSENFRYSGPRENIENKYFAVAGTEKNYLESQKNIEIEKENIILENRYFYFLSYRRGSVEFSQGLDVVNQQEVENELILTISWPKVEGADFYNIYLANDPKFENSVREHEKITEGNVEIALENFSNGEKYFALTAGEYIQNQLVGINTLIELEHPMEAFMDVDPTTAEGFLSFVYTFFFILLIGLYLGYLSVNTITKDFENKQLDITFSTPISRFRYVSEKFLFVAFYSFVLLAVIGGVIALSMNFLELGTASTLSYVLSSILSWPMFLVIVSVSFLASLGLVNSTRAIGGSFLFILVQYGITIVTEMGEAYDYLEPYTIISYWNFEEILFEEVYSMGNFIFLLGLSLIIFFLSVFLFQKRDIPG